MVGRSVVDWLRRNISPMPKVVALGRRPVEGSDIANIEVEDFGSSRLAEALGDTEIDIVVHLLGAGVHPAERDIGLLASINSFLAPRIVELGARHKARAVVIAGSSAEYRWQAGEERLTELSPLELENYTARRRPLGGKWR